MEAASADFPFFLAMLTIANLARRRPSARRAKMPPRACFCHGRSTNGAPLGPANESSVMWQ